MRVIGAPSIKAHDVPISRLLVKKSRGRGGKLHDGYLCTSGFISSAAVSKSEADIGSKLK